MSQKIKTSVEIDGSLSASQIANATADTDKFLVSDGGVIKYRTAAELVNDLGISAGTTSKVQHQVKAGVAINKGQAVYVTGADGTNMIVGLASNATEATSSKTMGLLNSTVSANGFADVITEGLLSGLDTSTAVAGNPVWLGTGGNLIYGLANKPYAPNHLVFIGIVTRVNANNGEIFVKVQNGFELDELHDVDLKTTTPINGHLLGFNGTLWVNKTIASWLGYTPQAQLNGTGFVKASGTTITYDNTSYYPASNPNGYISSYTETDTLATVTSRGNTANTSIAVRNSISINKSDGSSGGQLSYDSAINQLYLWNSLSSGYFSVYTNNSERLNIASGGAVTANVDMRSPIFYDSNNTGYYVDPASTSNLNLLTMANKITVGSFPNSTTNNGEAWIGRAADRPAGTMTVQLGGNNDRKFEVVDYAWTTVNFQVNGYGAAEASGSMRAPIFYDSNDTAYYINPSDADVSAVLKGTVTIGGGTGGNYDEGLRIIDSGNFSVITFGATGNAGAGRYQWLKNSSDVFELRRADQQQIWWANQNGDVGTNYISYAGSSSRAPIFYDSNNTGYYVDPASTSNLYNLTLTGGKHTYLYINPGNGYEAMVRYNGGSGNTWYAGKRTTGTSQAGTADFHFYSDAAGDTVFGIGADGTIKAKGDVVAYSSSDKELKDNILPIQNALEKVKQIGGYTFDWNDKQIIHEGHDVGVIAQEIESVLPEVVITRDTGFKAVKYEKIVPLLIEAIKEQQAQIEELKELVNKLINK